VGNPFTWRGVLRGSVFCMGLLMCATARGQAYYSSISGGYSNLQTQHTGSGLFYDHSGAYLDFDFGWRVPNPDFPLLLGLGITGSDYWDSHSIINTFPDGNVAQVNLDSDVGLFELEPRIGLALWSANMPGMFLKPRLGAGLLIDNYAIDQTIPVTGGNILGTQYHTGAAFEVRPAVQAGYSWGPGAFGAELSYMAAWGGFGRLGNDAQEFRAGVFFTFRY
jgi:hypothetical protein